MAHELRIQVAIPLEGDAISRAKDVAAFREKAAKEGVGLLAP